MGLVECKYCQRKQPLEAFTVCAVVKGKTYRRLRCSDCKRTLQNRRKTALRTWRDTYKETLRCERCGFADHRALEFHHEGGEEKVSHVADMFSRGFSRDSILREI